MTPRQLLDAARDLVERPGDDTAGLWSRAATLLTRQALEGAMAETLVARAPGSQAASFSAQLLVLGEVLEDSELAARAAYTWSALSRASHQQGHELSAGDKELRRWMELVGELVG
jgi:hypothetical protein